MLEPICTLLPGQWAPSRPACVFAITVHYQCVPSLLLRPSAVFIFVALVSVRPRAHRQCAIVNVLHEVIIFSLYGNETTRPLRPSVHYCCYCYVVEIVSSRTCESWTYPVPGY